MAIVPLHAVFRGDFISLLVSVEDNDTIETVAQKVAHHVVNRRLPAQDAPLRVVYNDKILPSEQTVTEAGIAPLGYVEVFYDD